MPQIDRITARALTEAGYMPLSEYIEMFGDEVSAEAAIAKEPIPVGSHRTRPWSVPAHFASPIRGANYRVRYQQKRLRA